MDFVKDYATTSIWTKVLKSPIGAARATVGEEKQAWARKKDDEAIPVVAKANIHDVWMDWKAWKAVKDTEKVKHWSCSARVNKADIEKLLRASGNEVVFIRRRAVA